MSGPVVGAGDRPLDALARPSAADASVKAPKRRGCGCLALLAALFVLPIALAVLIPLAVALRDGRATLPEGVRHLLRELAKDPPDQARSPDQQTAVQPAGVDIAEPADDVAGRELITITSPAEPSDATQARENGSDAVANAVGTEPKPSSEAADGSSGADAASDGAQPASEPVFDDSLGAAAGARPAVDGPVIDRSNSLTEAERDALAAQVREIALHEAARSEDTVAVDGTGADTASAGAMSADTTSADTSSADMPPAVAQHHGTPLLVLLVPTTGGEDIADYARRVERQWLPQRGPDTASVLIVVAKADRRMRIAIGPATRQRISDAQAAEIIEQQMVPAFRRQDFAGGLRDALGAIDDRLQAAPSVHADTDASAQEAGEQRGPGALWLGFAAIFASPFVLIPLFGLVHAARHSVLALAWRLVAIVAVGAVGAWQLAPTVPLAAEHWEQWMGVGMLTFIAFLFIGSSGFRAGGLPGAVPSNDDWDERSRRSNWGSSNSGSSSSSGSSSDSGSSSGGASGSW